MEPSPAQATVELAVQSGIVTVSGDADAAPATLRWDERCAVHVNGKAAPGKSAMLRAGDTVVVEAEYVPGRVDYKVDISRDRMQAHLTVEPVAERTRTVRDAEPTNDLELELETVRGAAPEPDSAGATAALAEADVSFGIDRQAVKAAVAEPGTRMLVATGVDRIDGEDGRLQPLIDWKAAWREGVEVGTPLVERIPSIPGTPGTDVTGRPLDPAPVKDPKLRAGEGCEWRDDDNLLVAAIDGSVTYSRADKRVDVRHELVLERVDGESGDIDFIGSLRITGPVQEGHSVRARGAIEIEGTVDRSTVESGGNLTVHGTVMSSELRAGADRAVYAGLIDGVTDLPSWLTDVGTHAAELQQAAEARGQDLSFGLAVQVIVERMYAKLLRAMATARDLLREAGEGHRELADRFDGWHRAIRTSANADMSTVSFQDLVGEVGAAVSQIRQAVEQPSDLRVSYMQASEIEATGSVTITGKGIFNSRIVAWNGLAAELPTAVVRGGSIISHGPVVVHEVGSPGGSVMKVVLGAEASLTCDRAYAGTVVQTRNGSHRFIADRTDVIIKVDPEGLDVQSFAA